MYGGKNIDLVTLALFSGIALMLKILSQDFPTFITMDTGVSHLELATFLVSKSPSYVGADALVDDQPPVYSERNFVTGVNLVRILQKLTKGKSSRVLQLFFKEKADRTLTKLLKIENPTFQQYTLKLLKDQSRYHGRVWKKRNMTVLSAIDRNVRHHIHDNWFYENCGPSEPCPLMKEQDATLLDAVDAFNDRYYAHEQDDDLLAQDALACNIFDFKWHGDEFHLESETALEFDGYLFPEHDASTEAPGGVFSYNNLPAEMVSALNA